MRRLGGVAACVLAVLAGLLMFTVPGTQGRLQSTIANTTDTVASGTYDPCATAISSIGGNAFFVLPLDDASGSSARDISGNSRPGTYNGGYTLNDSGPCSGSSGRSVLLDGSSGFVHDAAQQSNPQTFAVQVWFRTTTSVGGRLVGFGNGSGTSESGSYDRHVYLRNDGRLTFGVFPNSIQTVTSSRPYNDGQWHQVVATLSPAGLLSTSGMRLYVDGSLVASNRLVGSAEVFNGSWRMGWDNLDTWPSAPSSYYFKGNLAYGAVWNTALTPTQVSALWAARG